MAVSPLIIVGCTDRKSLPVHAGLKLGGIPRTETLEGAASRWINTYKTIRELSQMVPLRDLYQGEYWKVSLGIESRFETLVASAGIGMHRLNDLGIGYTATFTRGVEDSVLRFRGESPQQLRNDWWRFINARGSLGWSDWKSKCSPRRGRRTVLVAISDGYQQALANDLNQIAGDWANVIVVSGSKALDQLVAHPNIHHIQVSQELRMVLGGSTPCVGIRFVNDVLTRNRHLDVDSVEAHLNLLKRRYQKLSQDDKLPIIRRQSFRNDQELIRWISTTIAEQKIKNPTKSALLRLLRDEGRACEQKRFGALFESALSGSSADVKFKTRSR